MSQVEDFLQASPGVASSTANPQANAYFDDVVRNLEQLAIDIETQGKTDTSLSRQNYDVNARSEQNGVTRTPWIMSTTEWLTSNPPRAMLWAANPSDITWSMPQRSTHTKNMFGTVLHVWPDSGRDTFFDELRLTFTLQSGNIMPVWLGSSNNVGVSTLESILGKSALTDKSNWQLAPGLVNFYDFMLLVDAPKLTAPDANGRSRTNVVSIQYSSNLFPSLTLMGMFDSAGIRFTDSSSSPNQVNSWQADFIVYDTYPRLSGNSDAGQTSNASLLSSWLDQRVRNIRGGLPSR